MDYGCTSFEYALDATSLLAAGDDEMPQRSPDFSQLLLGQGSHHALHDRGPNAESLADLKHAHALGPCFEVLTRR
jgi:hypothetical protein